MAGLTTRTLAAIQRHGFVGAARRAADRVQLLMTRNKILSESSLEGRFSTIQEKNYWGSDESLSGPGSTLETTENLRSELPTMMEQFSVESVFDAPCGDFNWMKLVCRDNAFTYIGGDIVGALVDKNNAEFAGDHVRFQQFDITKDPFPDADLWICRDCLFHLSYRDILAAMENFCRSNIRYVLTTTHLKDREFENSDIESGMWRRFDLFSPPFSFPQDVRYRIRDGEGSQQAKEMCLWDRKQILDILPVLQKNLA